MVSKVHFGSFYGTATANVNMVDVFKEAEKLNIHSSILTL